ncbi:AraC family transcriptional regulator [Fodinibius sediminis]|uniref:Uncharacterized protein n=1 Tax=Fodinibius sediminis TaxID=1214077 RepID=A0A521CGI6_9BACT|nr:AraC family transcriptional regulator [Fodinibius sediminis]SMO58529.1 hypothetical protein SAMN06265218_10661 [Fodinibius sediminis]
MGTNEEALSTAIQKLRNNLSDIARVQEWADFMGYEDPKTFGEKFHQHYNVRPHRAMVYIRLKSVARYLRDPEDYSNHHIARVHSFPGEKALNNFTNYHTGYCPTDLKTMPEEQVHALLEKLGSKIRE